MQLHDKSEWSRRLGISDRRTEQMVASGELPPPIRIGRLRRWTDEQIDEYIRALAEVASRGRPRAPEPESEVRNGKRGPARRTDAGVQRAAAPATGRSGSGAAPRGRPRSTGGVR